MFSRGPAGMVEGSRVPVPPSCQARLGDLPSASASSKSERVFSVAGNVVTPKKVKLNPEKVEDLAVVKCNLKLLKIMGFIK